MTTPSKFQQIKDKAEASLEDFIKLVAPHRVLASFHRELIQWWTRSDALTHQLTLLPRDHGKSAMIAYRVAWTIVRKPDVRIIYLSATSDLAEKQLKMVKDILTSPMVMRFWPELINQQESKRAKWTSSEIEVDHPLRKQEGVRDPTIKTGGLNTSLTGFHCDVAVLDDIVVKENAYTELGRRDVAETYSLLASIEGTDAQEWVVGTRYHPKDLYNDLLSFEEEVYNDEGEVISARPVYEVFERQVEDVGDGTGEFLWPRQMRHDGKWFGFDMQILAKKKAKYIDKTQFRAQYYNDPNNPDGIGINRDKFQYYDRVFLGRMDGGWSFKGRKLNVFAALDLAYTINKRSDYTAIVIVGVDSDNNIYVLDCIRFKTEKISEMFKEVHNAFIKWGFRKIRCEITAGQKTIVSELRDTYIKQQGLALTVDTSTPTKHVGSKQERISAILEPRYEDGKVWHYQGGNCQILEDELILEHPPHDDLKDALSNAIENAVAPQIRRVRDKVGTSVVSFNNRFGGIAH